MFELEVQDYMVVLGVQDFVVVLGVQDYVVVQELGEGQVYGCHVTPGIQ